MQGTRRRGWAGPASSVWATPLALGPRRLFARQPRSGRVTEPLRCGMFLKTEVRRGCGNNFNLLGVHGDEVLVFGSLVRVRRFCNERMDCLKGNLIRSEYGLGSNVNLSDKGWMWSCGIRIIGDSFPPDYKLKYCTVKRFYM